MLKITETLLAEIKAHGVTSYPYEGCGLLVGLVEDGANVVTAVHPLPNIWPVEEEKRIRFRIAEDDWRDVELAAMTDDRDVIGVFHSHPDNPPIASPRDLAWAAWPGYSYLIIEINNREPASILSWQLLADRSGFVAEKIVEKK